MADITASTIALESAMERLRQERETFDQRKEQQERWFVLRLRMGYVAAVLLPTIAALSGYIVANPADYSPAAVTAASGALLVDVLGLLGAVWKIVLSPESVTKLSPVTTTVQIGRIADSEN